MISRRDEARDEDATVRGHRNAGRRRPEHELATDHARSCVDFDELAGRVQRNVGLAARPERQRVRLRCVRHRDARIDVTRFAVQHDDLVRQAIGHPNRAVGRHRQRARLLADRDFAEPRERLCVNDADRAAVRIDVPNPVALFIECDRARAGRWDRRERVMRVEDLVGAGTRDVVADVHEHVEMTDCRVGVRRGWIGRHHGVGFVAKGPAKRHGAHGVSDVDLERLRYTDGTVFEVQRGRERPRGTGAEKACRR